MRSNLGFKIWDYQCESFRRLGHPNVPRLFKFELTYPSNFLESEDDSSVEKSEKVHYTLRARARRHVWKHFVENCHPTNLSFKSKFCLGLWRWVRGSQYPAILPRWKSENQRDTKNSIKKAGKSRNSKAERQGREREGMTTSIAEVCCPETNTKYLKIGRAITLARYALSFGLLVYWLLQVSPDYLVSLFVCFFVCSFVDRPLHRTRPRRSECSWMVLTTDRLTWRCVALFY